MYICAPYTPRCAPEDAPRVAHQNVKRAVEAGLDAWRKGWVPLIPHLMHYISLEHARGYGEWMRWSLAYLSRCDAILVVTPDNLTRGMREEIDYCAKAGIPIFWGPGSLPATRYPVRR